MLNWLQEYWLLGLIALIIGIATGWWIWARGAVAAATLPTTAATPAAPLQPVRPDIVAAEPAQFVAAPPAAAPAPVAATSGPKIAAAVGASDNLLLLKGVGPKLNTLLISLGVTRFDQIAAWTAAEIAEVDGYLGNFKGRIARDNWVDQAGYLARGDKPGFEGKYGALGSEL